MMNYLTEIDRELAFLKQRLIELEIARGVIAGMSEAKPLSSLVTKTPKKVKATQKHNKTRLPNGALARSKEAILLFLKDRPPTLSRDIITELMSRGLAVGDSTVWKALKDLRDEGALQWNDETRMYSSASAPQREALSA